MTANWYCVVTVAANACTDNGNWVAIEWIEPAPVPSAIPLPIAFRRWQHRNGTWGTPERYWRIPGERLARRLRSLRDVLKWRAPLPASRLRFRRPFRCVRVGAGCPWRRV